MKAVPTRRREVFLESSEQILHPEKYGRDHPQEVTVEAGRLAGTTSLGQDTAGDFPTVGAINQSDDVVAGGRGQFSRGRAGPFGQADP